jgi:RNA polymerase sigma-70 factor (ECF subfamily)
VVHSSTPVLLRAAAVLTADRSDAEDLVRRTWLRAIRQVRCCQTPIGLTAWLCGLMLTEAAVLPGIRVPSVAGPVIPSQRFQPADDNRGPDRSPDRGPGHWADPPASWPSGASAVDELTFAAAKCLPAGLRVVVVLRDVAGCTVTEIAALLDTSPDLVRTTLNHARAGIRRSLEQALSDRVTS